MPFLTFLGFASSALSALSRASAEKRIASVQREKNSVTSATQEYQDVVRRRAFIRAERLRRGVLENASAVEGLGVGSSASSGLAGSRSSLSSSFGASLGQYQQQVLATRAIQDANQKAANIESSYNRLNAGLSFVNSGFQLADALKKEG